MREVRRNPRDRHGGVKQALVILVLFGVQWVSFWVPWGGEDGSFGQVLVLDKNQGALLTVVMVVVMVNAMNFVDGLDGQLSPVLRL